MNQFKINSKLTRFLLLTNLLFISLFHQTASASLMTSVFINEIHYDNIGGDIGEFIEIAAPAGTSLKDWSLAFYNGSNGLTYKNEKISDNIIVNNEANGFGFYGLFISGIQNGNNDGIALINASNELVQFISYEGQLTALDGYAIGNTSEDIQVYEENDTAIGFSLQLAGTGQYYQDFSWQNAALNSFNMANNSQNFIQNNVNSAIPVNSPNTIALYLLALFMLLNTYRVKHYR